MNEKPEKLNRQKNAAEKKLIAAQHSSIMELSNAILLFDILNISSEICYSLAGMRNPG